MSTLLLRYSGVPSILHLLRTVAPRLAEAAAIHHDKEIRTTFESIIGYKLSERNYQQLALSIKQGVFGLVIAAETSSSAFLGAWASSPQNLASREKKLENICSKLSDDFETGSTLISSELKEALQDVHQSSNQTKKLLPSLDHLSECPMKL